MMDVVAIVQKLLVLQLSSSIINIVQSVVIISNRKISN